MEDINVIVSNNLKEIREDRKLSLDKLSEITDVSKSMLGQIERLESSPSIQTLWKIAKGLKIPFTTLLDPKKSDIVLVKKENISPIVGDEGRFRIYPIFPFDEKNRFEILDIELDPGTSSFSEPHEDNTEEFVIVYDGEFTLKTNGNQYTIKVGNSIRYRSDREHSYHNLSKNLTKVTMIIYYPIL